MSQDKIEINKEKSDDIKIDDKDKSSEISKDYSDIQRDIKKYFQENANIEDDKDCFGRSRLFSA